MTHVRTQLRNAVKARLEAQLDGVRVHNASRMARPFQKNEFPLVMIAVAESALPVDGNPVGSRLLDRSMIVSINVALVEHVAVEDEIDALCGRIEVALAMPSQLGIGKLIAWRYAGVSAPSIEAIEEGKDSYSISQTITFTCSIQTADTDPTINVKA